MTDVSDTGARKTDRALDPRPFDGGDGRALTLRRTYDSSIADIWDACTRADRVSRWVGPISGDLRLGGRYQLEGNAGGTIEACDAPHYLRVTWEFMGGTSIVEVRLTALTDHSTELTLSHVEPDVDHEHWKRFGPGAAGVGWDLALLGLELELAAERADFDENVWAASDAGRAYIAASSDGWAAAHIASGAEADAARKAAESVRTFYTGDPD